MITPQHGKHTTIQSYYEGQVVSTKDEMEVSLFTTKESILKDVVDALSLINRGDTKKLEICVQVDDKKRMRMIKKWQL